MPTLAISPEVERGEYVVAQDSVSEVGITEFYYLMTCTPELAYLWFSKGILNTLRFSGKEGYIIINPKDLESGFWGFRGTTQDETDEPYDGDYDV